MSFAALARGAFAACLLLFLQSPAIRFDQNRNIILLEGWPGALQQPIERLGDVLSVSVDAPDVPSMLGRFRVDGGAIAFAPQYPLQPGVRYKAVARIPGMEPITTFFVIPKPDVKPTAIVQHVYPSANVLPENELKFYIHFSAPMSHGLAYEHISLIDETAGTKVDHPFLELSEELWDPEGVRFTLFFDPGRIKRGLVPHDELGVPIHEGRKYTLVIDRGWLDAEGIPLAADFRKTFSVGPSDRKNLDLKTWTVRGPAPGTQDPLVVEFPKPLDHAILEHELEIEDAAGDAVRGAVLIDRNETRWKFSPEGTWKRGSYTIRVGSALADLAGNMIDRPFEIDLFDPTAKPVEGAIHSLTFTVR